ncbi:MAG: S8 family serine peptidase [Planctomycetes bacterium]|nr:S8 family serine peptidase [Planctomycetota bacterium]
MKVRLLFSSLAVLVFVLNTFINIYAQEAVFTAPEKPQYVPGEVIVKYRESASSEAISSLSERLQLVTIDSFPFIGVQQAKISEAQTVEGMCEELSKMPDVEYAEPNYYQYALITPNDPKYSQQWGLTKIQAETAWDTATDSSNVIVAVIDSGVAYDHPDLKANMWKNPDETPNGIDDDNNGIIDDIYGVNYNRNTTSGDPMDDHDHGTHVAGIISAVGNNNTGVAGTTWKTQIIALKFLHPTPDGRASGSSADAIKAIDYAIKKKADIMNNSWGGGGFSRAIEDAIKRANAQGILFVAAAGNFNIDNDSTPHYPSSYNVDNIVAVMATDSADKRSRWGQNGSHWGKESVDLAAPGTAILSTVPNGGYQSFNGTSMATPFVSGAAALLKGKNNQWKAAELKARLMATVDKLSSLKDLCVSEGRLNLAKVIGVPDIFPCKDAPSHLACNEFFWSDSKQFSSNSNVLSTTFTLPDTMYVYVSADSSAHIVQGGSPRSFTTGLYLGNATNIMYTGSYRRGSFETANENSSVHTSFCIKLNKGTYTFYWKLWLSGYTVQCDSAVLSVRAFPCTMGGKLLSAAVGPDEAEVTIFNEEESVSPKEGEVDLQEMDMGMDLWQ